ncbi:MAG: carbon-nitrogen hydrolase family protein [Sphingomonadales bacterium]|jgi:nitrilase
MSKTVRAAVVQAAPKAFDIKTTMERLEHLAKEAAEKGAKIAVFPEAFIGGYPKGLDFGARVGTRSEEGRKDFQRYFEAAIEVPGTVTDQLCKIAKSLAITLVVGVIERDGGTLYCTALYVGEDGTLLGKHRKLMPTAMERLIWGFGDGTTLKAVDTPVGRVGAVICWENYMPMLRTAMYKQGVMLYCVPTVDDRDSWLPTMKHIAFEGRCFVLSSCQFAERTDYPDDYNCIQGNDPETVLIRGGSCIIDPSGEVLVGPVFGEETVLVADLDLGAIARGKYDLDVVGHYERPDVFDLLVMGLDEEK